MRKILFRGIVCLASVTIALLASEIAVRAVDGVPVFTVRNFVVDMLALVRGNTGVVVHDELLGWRLREDFVADPTFVTGAYGVRMNDTSQKPLPKDALLAVGDSFTAGSGVAGAESWPAQLERLTGRPVLNAASGAWAVDQIVLRAEQLVPLVQPRGVIIGILAQDSLRNNFEIYGGGYKPYFVIQGGVAELRGVPVPRVTERGIALDPSRRILGYSYLVYWIARRMGREAQWIANEYRYKQVHENKVGVDISCLLMDRLTALRAKYGLRVVVVMQYGGAESQGAEPPWYGPPVLACAQERGFGAVDTYGPLHDMSIADPERFKGLWINEGGQLGHMSAAGNRFIAELLRDRVAE